MRLLVRYRGIYEGENMIEIIKPGKNIPIKKLKTTCSICKCEFKFDFEDMCNDLPIEFFPDVHKYYIICPNCNEVIWDDEFEIFEE